METKNLAPSPTIARYSWLQLSALYVMWMAFFLFIFRYAWVSEDAYITFRVIENAFAGYGLRWNVHERVQAYTHPLWMLLHLPLVALFKNVFFSSIILSVLCCAAALLVALATLKKPVWACALFLFTPLALSKSFVDYSSSGLENPLSFLLYACFCFVCIRLHENKYFWFYASLTTALALFNRMDVLWLYAPTLIYFLFTKQLKIKQIATGALPLVSWLTFSLFYYGFLFPNTKYAKLNTGIDYQLYLNQGLEYFRHLFITDTIGSVLLLSMLLCFLPRRLSPFQASPLVMLLGLGIILQITYVITVGGDYMTGRFWALPIFAAVLLWFHFGRLHLRPDIVFMLACLLITAYGSSKLLIKLHHQCKECVPLRGRVIDAARVFGFNRIVMKLHPLHIRSEGHYPFAREGKKIRKENPDVKKLFFVGMSAYYAGPASTFIDELALADPLLARLPSSPRQRFYISHFRRDIPKGYEHALRTGSLEKMHPSLARYYRELRTLTSGDVFSTTRLKTILLFNLGYYDSWKNEYISDMKKKDKSNKARTREQTEKRSVKTK